MQEENMEKIKKYFNVYEGTPRGKNSSVHCSEKRLNKALEQISGEPAAIDKIIKYVKEFFGAIGIKMNVLKIKIQEDYNLSDKRDIFGAIGIEMNVWEIEKVSEINYDKIQKDYNLSDKRDIIWMKFTKDGYLGVVAVSNDINFDIPKEKKDYNEKRSKNKWKYNTAGILVHQLNKSWDDTFVLVFPLANIPDKYKRGDIERAVGNYLIDKNVPIIDFYSHNY
jgi:hypothetical protein